ncbi:MAG: hypothetical protein H6721_00365 [Sandaracinus sp.]|nr:hypothetical protein [Sandaracinus sp.]MCB9614957.1 hypothetical protein [Sandaracinus sp.]MCB9618552.1 hypothetical protein [Sandaracinus sp.]MCB9622114.1 hypothetical protein [Sandaracinus sp.]MCB9630596.1 hypothetical protein [Sandaracinus sp.]
MANRTLRFTISSALVAAPLALGVACGGGSEEPHTNVTAGGEEEPQTNVHPEHEHEHGDPATNPDPETNPAPEEEPMPTANPAPAEE